LVLTAEAQRALRVMGVLDHEGTKETKGTKVLGTTEVFEGLVLVVDQEGGMRLPTIQGVIKRRLLVNFRADPEVVQKQLPSRFRPKLQDGYAVVGICLIRLEHLRPRLMPEFVGLSSENAAHRIAVLWDDEDGVEREGVFIPRRDTNSPVNLLLGGRVFPGEHHKAAFRAKEGEGEIALAIRSEDGEVAVEVVGKVSDELPATSIFPSVEAASAFFEGGSLGYSVTKEEGRLDGLRLETDQWHVEPLAVSKVRSSYFGDRSTFPEGSVVFDHALIMRNIEHEWHNAEDLRV
jgi:hypothetical protein